MKITIFTDGAARGNPGPGGWGAIVIFPVRKTPIANNNRITNKEWVQELGGSEKHTTNNRMELTAVIKALEFISKKIVIPNSSLIILLCTDSSYVMRGAKTWVHDWAKNKWKTKQKKDVLNKDLWKKFLKVSKDFNIGWKLLPGHSGIPANDRCDQIATAFADNKKPKLYSGILQNYGIDIQGRILRIPKGSTLISKKKRSSSKPYSYVSLVGGIVQTHVTWAECERRVKGVSNAKFKKSISFEDEQLIINRFRV